MNDYYKLRQCGEKGHQYIFNQIKESIESNKPIFIGKIGSIELQLIYQTILIEKRNLDDYLMYLKYEVTNASGLYPDDNNTFKLFVNEYLESIKDIDILASWNDKMLSVEEWIYKLFINKNLSIYKGVVDLQSLESFYTDSKNWWQNLFENKTILIISPFTESISKQLLKRDDVWKGKWENFWSTKINFKYIKFPHPYYLQSPEVQSSYPKHYRYLIQDFKNKIKEIGDFDIALIGTGCYSILLGSYIKTELKKSAFHLGGGLQMMFGVYGNRWFQNGNMSNFFKEYINEHWCRPSNNEKPSGFKKQEDGCYF